MALKVWLPLNGTLENQGLSNVSSYSGSTPVYSAGKIGQCLEGSSGEITFHFDDADLIKNICLNKKYTIMTWLKNNAASSGVSRWVFRIGNGTGTSRGLWENNSGTTRHWAFSGTGVNCSTSIDCTQGWHHTCFVVDGTIVTLYVDGVKQGTATDSTTLPTENTITFNSYRDSLNDFRLYDEVLSDKQIKEIAKGLCAHYKLEGVGANPNLALNTLTTSPSSFYDYTGKASASRVTDNNVATSVYKIDFPEDTATYSTYNLYTGIPRDASAVTQDGKTYTLSFKIKASKALSNYKLLYEYNNSVVNIDIGTKWQKVTMTGVANNQYSALYVCHGGRDNRLKINGGSLYIAEIKLELGDKATDWIPNEADSLYTELGYNKVLTTDVSGFGYNGTQSGTLTFNIDSPRYAGSTKFNAGLINSPAGVMLATSKDFTINGWFYYKSGTSYYASADTYNTSVCLENARYFVYNPSGTAYVGYWTNTANAWQMITLVHDSTAKILKLYVNGRYINGVATSGEISSNEILNIGGRQNTASFVGSMSDFRIYSTALSAEDILKLYEISGIIDNKGNTYSYEFKEE